MSAMSNEYNNLHKSIVFVDSERFLKLWQNDPDGQESKLAHGSKEVWESDYKFDLSEKGFSHGIENPVPLAYCSCEICPKVGPHSGFTNGITRTIWLLAKGASSFPVEASNECAINLNKYAGIGKEVLPAYKFKDLTMPSI
jgi:hypothetical protein